jgi:hypothetical protein
MDTLEKIGALSAKADAAHNRIDKIEVLVRDDLKEIKKELKELAAYMNRGKGWGAALIFFSGFAGAGMTKLIAMIFTK